MKTLKIGTRGSLLARSQASYIKNILEKNYPDKSFELEIIKTQGDIIQDRPLQELEGKDFFTKELDYALLTNEVDLVIHSGKDLGSERPDGIITAAVPKRALPNDILFIKKSTQQQLIKNSFDKDFFVVGTSSPRRIAQIPYLKDLLPGMSQITLKHENLRGNIDTRIQKLLDNKYDAIILASAGIERVSYLKEGEAVLKELMKDLSFSILPIRTHTPAAAQGALIIETLDKNEDLKKMINALNHEQTRQEIYQEKKIFNENGGTCYLPLGIYVKSDITYQSGKNLKDIEINSVSSQVPLPQMAKQNSIFIGLSRKLSEHIVNDQMIEKNSVLSEQSTSSNSLLATSHSIENFKKSKHIGLIFCSGINSMRALASNSYWCHGSLDSLGEQTLSEIQSSKSFNLMADFNAPWKVFTHPQSKSDLGEIVSSYDRKIAPISAEFEQRLKTCKVFYWTSFFQYQKYSEHFEFLSQNDIVHFTGIGKTHKEFELNKIAHTPIASYEVLINTYLD